VKVAAYFVSLGFELSDQYLRRRVLDFCLLQEILVLQGTRAAG
jgi:hypothetical protein